MAGRIDMADSRYPYELPPLPYAYGALEPYIDEETMRYHHDKHFQTYVNNLNAALEPLPRLQEMTLRRLLSNPAVIPPSAREKVLNNGGGVYNHNLYFNGLAPAREPVHQPEGLLADAIDRRFGSFDAFKAAFSEKALSVFGSGYAALVYAAGGPGLAGSGRVNGRGHSGSRGRSIRGNGRGGNGGEYPGLEIVTMKNQDTALPRGLSTLLLLDVWEHAYYLKYKNERASYVESAWNLLAFPMRDAPREDG